jgi:acyl-CoA synthetase (AMP-forming)/AMP-acid ligase II
MPSRFSDHFVLPVFDAKSAPESDLSIKTVSDLIDFNAENNPDQLFCLQAEKGLNESKNPPFLRITYRSFRDMIIRCQQWIEEHVPEIHPPALIDGNIIKCRPLALLLDSDIGLLVHLFALMGMGVPVSY